MIKALPLFILVVLSVWSVNVIVDHSRPPYVNIVMPAWNEARISGGPKTVYILGICLSRAGFNIRFIDDKGVGRPLDSTIVAWESDSTDLAGLKNLPWHDFATGDIPVSENDLFMATWCHSKLKTDAWQRATNASKLSLYIIQDDEQWLCGAEALRGYGVSHFAIFNGPPLAYWFETKGMGVFDPKYPQGYAATHSHLALAALRPISPPLHIQLTGVKRRFAVYYRQHTERNMYTTLEQLIRKAVLDNLLSVDEWDFVGISDHGPLSICGSKFTKIPGDNRELPETVCLQVQKYMRLQEYDDYLNMIDIAVSLCSSGGASWPIMDFALHGAVTVTNGVSAAHETFFRDLSSLILVSNSTELTSLYKQLELAVTLNAALTPTNRLKAMKETNAKFPESFCSKGCFGSALNNRIREMQTGIPIPTPVRPLEERELNITPAQSWFLLIFPFVVVATLLCVWLRPVPRMRVY